MTLGTKWYDFPGKQTLRFWDLHAAGLLGSYLWNNHVREWGKQDLGERKVELQWLPLILWGALEQGCSYRTALHQARAWVFVLPHQSVHEWGWLSQEGTQKWCISSQHPWQLKNWVPQSQSSIQVVFLNIHQKTNNQNDINLRILFHNTCVFHIYL